LAVSLHEEPKNTIKRFSKIRPEDLKQSQEKAGGGTSHFFKGHSKTKLTDLGVVGWFLGGQKSTRAGQIFV
jgi:hypothetical protein